MLTKGFANVENICLQYELMASVFTVSEDLSQYFCRRLSQNLPVFVFLSKCSGICISPQLSICYFVFDSFERAGLHFTAQSVVGRAFVDGHTLYLSCSPGGICGQGASYGTVLHRYKRSVLAQNRTL